MDKGTGSLRFMGIGLVPIGAQNVVEWMMQKDLQARKRRVIINNGKAKKSIWYSAFPVIATCPLT